MNEKLSNGLNKVKAFVVDPKTKAVAKVVAEYAIIFAVSAAVGYGLRKAGNAIDAKFFNKEVPPQAL